MARDATEFLGLGLLALLLAAALAWRAQPRMDPVEVRWAGIQGRGYKLVDARPPEQYQRNHLPGAFSVPGSGPVVPTELQADDGRLVVYGDGLAETVKTAQALANYQSQPVMILLDPPLPRR